MPIYLNPYQPRRNPALGKSRIARFRTFPREQANDGRKFRVTHLSNQLCQIQLYRWARSEEFTNMVGIGDLHAYLFISSNLTVSKTALGRTILNAVDYDPRKLKGASKNFPKATPCYHFLEREDLTYGLEYQICAWLRQFLKKQAPPDGSGVPEDAAQMEEELDLLVSTPWQDMAEIYFEGLVEETIVGSGFNEPEWRKLRSQWNKDNGYRPEELITDHEEVVKYPAPSGSLRKIEF